jgi:hypothetical protein
MNTWINAGARLTCIMVDTCIIGFDSAWTDNIPARGQFLLAPVYGWFTEGFDSLDLKETKALLDALT